MIAVARQSLVVWTNRAGVIAPLVCPCRNPRPVPFGLRFPGIWLFSVHLRVLAVLAVVTISAGAASGHATMAVG